jgi:glycine/serine hydroxymethyltransferase
MAEPEMERIAELIVRTLKGRDDDLVVAAVRADVAELCSRFTPYGD